MHFKKVITNIPHEIRRDRTAVDDFLVMDVNAVNVWSVAQALGALQADAQTMNKLVSWASNPESEEYVFLISLDGKYGVIMFADDVEKPTGDSQILFLKESIDADYTQIKKELIRAMLNDPDFAKLLNFKPAEKLIPERVTLDNAPMRFSVEELPREIGGVNSVLENSTDDSLVWLALVGANNGVGFTPEFNVRVKSELKLRIQKKMSFLATFFPLDSVTEKEIDARARRVKRALEAFDRKFPANEPINMQEVERYARRMSTDRLAELAVVRYYTEAGFDEVLKHLAVELQQRLSHGWT